MESFVDAVFYFLIASGFVLFFCVVYPITMVIWYKLIQKSKRPIKEILKDI